MTRTSGVVGAAVVGVVVLAGCSGGGTAAAPTATVTATVTVTPSTSTSAQPETTSAAPTTEATGAERPAPAPGAPAFTADGDHLDVAALHAQGVDHQVGDYRLQMDSYTADATSQVLAFNPYNAQPSEGAFGMATWTITYTGATEGNPWLDVTTAVMGADGNQYPSNQCAAVIDDGLMTEVRTLNPGGSYQFATCYDAPSSALQAATAVRAGTVQRTDRVDWTTRPAA